MNEEHIDTVIIGSGLGESAMADRLAEAGFLVCVLEHGKAYPPGLFPQRKRREQESLQKSTAILRKRAVKNLNTSHERSMVKY